MGTVHWTTSTTLANSAKKTSAAETLKIADLPTLAHRYVILILEVALGGKVRFGQRNSLGATIAGTLGIVKLAAPSSVLHETCRAKGGELSSGLVAHR